MRHLAFAFCLAGLTAGTAAAKPARPTDGALLPRTTMPALAVVGGSPIAAAHVQAHADALVACTKFSRATFLRVRVSLRWDARARIVRANITSGSSAAFNRCASRALGGSIADVTARGTAQATLTIRKPAIVIAPAPAPKGKLALQTCTVDDDCTLHFQESACVNGDPVAVNKSADHTAVLTAFPMRRIECGMGGPQYDDLRDSVTNRWSAGCEKSRCIVHDAGPQPTMRSGLDQHRL